jgi:hypothetical protein
MEMVLLTLDETGCQPDWLELKHCPEQLTELSKLIDAPVCQLVSKLILPMT